MLDPLTREPKPHAGNLGPRKVPSAYSVLSYNSGPPCFPCSLILQECLGFVCLFCLGGRFLFVRFLLIKLWLAGQTEWFGTLREYHSLLTNYLIPLPDVKPLYGQPDNCLLDTRFSVTVANQEVMGGMSITEILWSLAAQGQQEKSENIFER